jgi:hypothetical protein
MAKPKAPVLIETIREAKGNISAVADAFGVARKTVYDWIESMPTAQQALADARERSADTAISKLHDAVDDGNLNAIFYVINNSPETKRRGWGPRHEVTGADGDALTIRVTVNDG